MKDDNDIKDMIDQTRADDDSKRVVVRWRRFGHEEQQSKPLRPSLAQLIIEKLKSLGISSKVDKL